MAPKPRLVPGHSDEHRQYLAKIIKRKNAVLAAQIIILAAFFALWEAAARFKWIDPFIFSQPSRIILAAAAMIRNGSLFVHMGVTLGETVAGFVLGTVIGTAVSIALWWNSFLERVLNPYLVVLNSLPKTALAPILIVILGNNVKSVIATALMISVVVTVLTVLSGFMEVDKDKIKLLKTFGGTRGQILQKVILPASVPTILNALKINVGLSFVGVIVGEFLVAQAGLGYLIVYGSQIFKMDWVIMNVYQAYAAYPSKLPCPVVLPINSRNALPRRYRALFTNSHAIASSCKCFL